MERMELTEKVSGPETSFKKPMLVGKIGRLPKRMQDVKIAKSSVSPTLEQDDKVEEFKQAAESDISSAQKLSENVKVLPYDEPSWSGLPESSEKEYVLEVLKNGIIIETINLMKRPFWVFGRLANCDICMQHPTISRYHAVLQYRSESSETSSPGYYIYDLESTHGTFLNKNRIKSRIYARMHVGHMLKLGCSTRTYLLNGPTEDTEEESALSVTELKQKRQEELRRREKQIQDEEELRKKQEERGIDWGLGEDADEETDLSENPFAETNNEELYIDNPKKALRGFFEREGLDLEYDCTEQGMGQFLCKVELPVDDEVGRPIFAEVFHKGKKKEAVVQCALEACRILDRHGLLRQATHESRKRKPKNWEENDYYDSDDDTFLDRTGTVEKKREMRMKAKVPQKPETYESLLEKEKSICTSIKNLEVELADAQRKLASQNASSSSDTDSLDSFMMELKQSKPNKQAVNKLKSEIIKQKQEHANIIKLINITKPASLPPLVANYDPAPSSSDSSKKKVLPLIGKRKKIKLQLATKSSEVQVTGSLDTQEDEEEEEEEDNSTTNEKSSSNLVKDTKHSETNLEAKSLRDNSSGCTMDNEIMGSKEFETIVAQHRDQYHILTEILYKMKRLEGDANFTQTELEFIKTKQNQVVKLLSEEKSEDNEISSSFEVILSEVKKMLRKKSKEESKSRINMDATVGEESNQKYNTADSDESKRACEDTDERRKRKKQRRIQHKQERAEMERQKGYAEDMNKEDYNMWVPPSDQSGDGRTMLNDKYGY